MGIKKDKQEGWRDGSAVENTDRSSDGPEFKSQPPHGGSQPSIRKSDTLSYSVLIIIINKFIHIKKTQLPGSLSL